MKINLTIEQADSWQPTPEDIFAVDWKLVVLPINK